ncbi:MAG: aspartate aminotransferase family protein [Rhodospirillaceae bacterium]|jgi:adenosylmethionine-8-amino-7-oxononanoate aminotransferase|nr:aspartate aminotransferase family protein [Rhodospirillaceae bacterium]MBT5245333.1 aspartate aminotransferase family protein [Rhodospirillaceae bacterium]MBT5561194.1 aspartate aminotransferase family protein [Rhodospirillaceae bacterium]MBT6242730.1 aspartate aminotransferase family protein [Rhodospirillaceae bacterium]MBT7137276.1 aspartate aminotransferase family protein [Rhodospirillaceae bacterium]
MSRIFQRRIKSKMPVAVAGEGVYLIDSEGKRYIDASGGAAVSCLGHGDDQVIAAIQQQAGSLAFAHTGFFTSAPAEELAEKLIRKAPAGINWVYFVSGGSEAIEAAIKMARQYVTLIDQPQRRHIIARHQSYHGNTLGALSVGGHLNRRAPYQPLLLDTHHISPCYPYRGKNDGESDVDYGLRVAGELEQKILELGPDTVCAFIAETVVGATLGAACAVEGYFKRIREICDQYGVLLILDEVMCGMGRTGSLYACEQEGVSPDLLCMAKGLGAGYQPIGAAMVSDKLFAAFRDGPGFFQHGHTYMGHPTACAAALAVQQVIEERNLLEAVNTQGEVLADALVERFGNQSYVGDIRGRGLFRGIELVRDRATKEPFDPDLKLAARIKAEAFARGLVCYPDGGTADGVRGDHILLAPPFIINNSEIDEVVDKLGQAIDSALAQAGA